MDTRMSKDNFLINFSGVTHDHAITGLAINNSNDNNESEVGDTSCSTIAILRRHPMYDCLVLVKKFRSCLDGYALEFPTDKLTESEMESFESESEQQPAEGLTNDNRIRCRNRRLVSRFLDGDDFMSWTKSNTNSIGGDSCSSDRQNDLSSPSPVMNPFEPQVDDRGEPCELVHVPINGLLDRLESYTRSGLAVDSRVYAFAMGLKTSERILTTNSMKELQETPI